MYSRVRRASTNPGRESRSQTLRRDGMPLGTEVRAIMESHFAHDFSRIKVHADRPAADAATALGARAFTSGNDIVFGAGEYRPHTQDGRYVLAHELRHVVQKARQTPGAHDMDAPNSAVERDAHEAAMAVARDRVAPPMPRHLRPAVMQRLEMDPDRLHRPILDQYRFEHDLPLSGLGPDGGQVGPTDAQIKYGPRERKSYVFIMGADRPHTNNPFYTVALRYFHAHYPSAVFVTDKRTLTEVLTYVGALDEPVGTMYLVAHANEDGTLSFGLDSTDRDARTDANELREALHPASGASRLPSVNGNIDAASTISIKGCNIGQSQTMVELVDEAFGGAGTVVAPKYEQAFGVEPRFGVVERQRVEHEIRISAEHDQQKAEFLREYEERFVEREQTTEGLSGPHIERPGTRLFTAAEINAEIAATFSDLPAAERRTFARQLAKRQHVAKEIPWTVTALLPTNRRALAAFAPNMKGFRARRLLSHSQTASPPVQHIYTFADQTGGTLIATVDEPDPAQLLADGRARSSRADHFDWSIEQTRHGDRVTFAVVGRRVVAELRHQGIRDVAGRPYDPSTEDPRFYSHSTFAPPPAPAAPKTP